jgi:diguanylate cyclase (GGDEF)-like protein/PAS domain S-box-containing protein
MDHEVPMLDSEQIGNLLCPNSPSVELNESFYRSLVDNLHDGVFFVDVTGSITYWNNGAERLTGYRRHEVLGKQCFENVMRHVDHMGCSFCATGCPLNAPSDCGKAREVDTHLLHKLGHRVPVSARVIPIKDESGRIIGAIEVLKDVSARKRVERRAGELESLAYYDDLTGVPNRRFLELKVQQSLQDVQVLGESVGLMLIDLDHFKNVNDMWGHPAGDLVLQAMTRTLVHSLRPTDVIGRWGGEEFLVILPNTNSALLRNICERCRILIAENDVPVSKHSIRITVSGGATLLQTSDSVPSALKRADELLYQSKASGRNRITFG